MKKKYLCAILWIIPIVAAMQLSAWNTNVDKQRSHSVFPVFMYDSDIGFGFGGKGIVKNQFQKDESFDLILFGSTRGEQWYVFTFSVPDFEIRHGKRYPVSLDVKLEYDKLLKSNFFGIGNDSQDNDHTFPREFVKMEAALSRAFTERFIGECFVRFAHYSVYGYDPVWGTLSTSVPGAGETSLSAVGLKIRFDTRDSQINPRRGIRIEVLSEKAVRILGSDWGYAKVRFEASVYQSLFNRNHVLAVRLWSQQIDGNVPYEELSKIGDSWTGRGYKADRFLDKAMALASTEYRLPVFRKLGCVVFMDIGRGWPSFSGFGWRKWHEDGGVGLRYYLENFVVRLDVGMSKEGTRVFINFGQVF
jgi:outer membrane protein assembly factor BamA